MRSVNTTRDQKLKRLFSLSVIKRKNGLKNDLNSLVTILEARKLLSICHSIGCSSELKVHEGSDEKLLMNIFPCIFHCVLTFLRSWHRQKWENSKNNTWRHIIIHSCRFYGFSTSGKYSMTCRRLQELFLLINSNAFKNKYFSLLKMWPNLSYSIRDAFIPSISTGFHHFSTQLTDTLNKKLLRSFLFVRDFFSFCFFHMEIKMLKHFCRFQQNKHKKWINCILLNWKWKATKYEPRIFTWTEILLRDRIDKQLLVNLIFLLVVWLLLCLVEEIRVRRLIFSHL